MPIARGLPTRKQRSNSSSGGGDGDDDGSRGGENAPWTTTSSDGSAVAAAAATMTTRPSPAPLLVSRPKRRSRGLPIVNRAGAGAGVGVGTGFSGGRGGRNEDEDDDDDSTASSNSSVAPVAVEDGSSSNGVKKVKTENTSGIVRQQPPPSRDGLASSIAKPSRGEGEHTTTAVAARINTTAASSVVVPVTASSDSAKQESTKFPPILLATLEDGTSIQVNVVLLGKKFHPTSSSSSLGRGSGLPTTTTTTTTTSLVSPPPPAFRHRTKRLRSSSNADVVSVVATTTTPDDENNNNNNKNDSSSIAAAAAAAGFAVEKASFPVLLSTTGTTTARSSSTTTTESVVVGVPLGRDGNFHYCKVCKGFGDVVCCDGCPEVYHLQCIPADDPSRIALANDDEPWYCPDCMMKNNNNNNKSKKQSKKSKVSKSNTKLKMSGDKAAASIPSSSASRQASMDPLLALTGDSHAIERGGKTSHNNKEKKPKKNNKKRKTSVGDENAIMIDGGDMKGSDTTSEPVATIDDNEEDIDDYPIDDDEDSVSPAVEVAMDAIDDVETDDDEEDDDDDDDDDSGDGDDSDAVGDVGGEADDDSEDEVVEGGKVSTASQSHATLKPDTDDRVHGKAPKSIDLVGDAKQRGVGAKPANAKVIPTKKARLMPLPKKTIKASSEKPSKKSKKSLEAKNKKEKSRMKKDKKKKKKKKKKNETSDGAVDEDTADDPYDDTFTAMFAANNTGSVRATPGFYFFLGENRLKIERQLARKHRYFHRLPKGGERNQLIAQEGAMWWVKLRDSELKRFVNMSMVDFEQRVIEWKEEQNIQDMTMEADAAEMDMNSGPGEHRGLSQEDEMLTYENHQRLYLGTTVGSKPFKPDTDESNNRILLELLQDMRFHPLPMLQANRPTKDYGEMDFDRVTIPYFDVHGPVSSSLGDECLGCARGWTHFCNVIKRRIPAVEHRAKLQPPLSSLVATRIGLGFRPQASDDPLPETDEAVRNIELFATRELPEIKAAKNLPILPWETLSSPSLRADDIVQFVEEAICMKVPEPPRPNVSVSEQRSVEETRHSSSENGAPVPSRARKRPAEEMGTEEVEGEYTLNKCGRCRTIIQSDTGCVQCRRAQLVINMSKRGGREGPGASAASPGNSSSRPETNTSKLLRVQTNMLGRVVMRDCTGEIQTEGDEAVANHILRQRWTPFAVMPAQTLESPMPKMLATADSDSNETSDEDEDEQSKGTSSNEEAGAENTQGDEMALRKPLETIIEDNLIDAEDKNSNSTDIEENVDESADSENDEQRASSKRTRTSARIVALSSNSTTSAKVQVAAHLDEQDRQQLSQRFKEEADELHKQCLSVACFGLLLALTRRDPLLLFAEPVHAEGYHEIVRTPIDFGKIRRNALERKYSTLGSFVSDCRLLCTNALVYNPPGSIYFKTAKELSEVLTTMQKRASNWMNAIKDAHASSWRRDPKAKLAARGEDGRSDVGAEVEDPFLELRRQWPDALEMLENSDWLRKAVESDFMRTKENETAYYGSIAVRRAALAASLSLAPYPDSSGIYNPVGRRTYVEDENLRNFISEKVAKTASPPELKDVPTWREEMVMRVLRKSQTRRVEGMTGSTNGCARCDGMRADQELKTAMNADSSRLGRSRKKRNEVPRLHKSRLHLSTGLGSRNIQEAIKSRQEDSNHKDASKRKMKALIAAANKVKDVAVTVRGSRIHGMGLYADQPFVKGDVVAEYIGEYVSSAVTDARERMYQDQRIQDYQFRLDAHLVIDATMRGGHGRYINHNCDPNCIAKVIPGEAPNQHLNRVIIIAQRDIEPLEELSYDYQFPLELDLDSRIPCNCHSELCRGFMNWDLPEKGSNNQVFRTHKRGANMRDRIRRLGRPLKGEK